LVFELTSEFAQNWAWHPQLLVVMLASRFRFRNRGMVCCRMIAYSFIAATRQLSKHFSFQCL